MTSSRKSSIDLHIRCTSPTSPLVAAASPSIFPVIPPKRISRQESLPPEEKPDDNWYYVRSPREEHGAVGPYTIDDLRIFKQSGDIKDGTLLWQPGQRAWQQLRTLPALKSSLLVLPPIPNKNDESSNVDMQAPILDAPSFELIQACRKLVDSNQFTISRACFRCGSIAEGHVPEVGEQRPDLLLLRHPIGAVKPSSEILPGFLWVGNSACSKSKFIEQMGFTLIINCTDDMRNPKSKPPTFRCHQLPLPEKLPSVSSFEPFFETFEACYDHLENARLAYERADEVDLAPPEYRGPIDKYGRPIRTKKELAILAASRKPKEETSLCRVLLWSRLGSERPCVLIAAYLVRKWGMKLSAAVEFISDARPNMKITPMYMQILEAWAKKFVLGELLCVDCLSYDSVQYAGAATAAGPTPVRTSKEAEIFETLDYTLELRSLYDIVGPAPSYLYIYLLDSKFCHESEYDVQLTGMHLSHDHVCGLFDVFHELSILPKIHSLTLSNLNLESDTLSYICELFETTAQVRTVHLSHIDISNNKITKGGINSLVQLLTKPFQVQTINLNNNPINDDGGYVLINALVQPEKDIFANETPDIAISRTLTEGGEMYMQQEQLKQMGNEEVLIGNSTLTDIRLVNTNIGKDTLTVLAEVLKCNPVLCRLQLDCNPLKSNDISFLMNELRVFNRSLRHLSYNDISISVPTFDHAMRVFESNVVLNHLSFASCGLQTQHITRGISRLAYAKSLRSLNLSSNNIQNMGATKLSNVMVSSTNTVGETTIFPLQCLDVSYCSIGIAGVRDILLSIKDLPSFQRLNISHNPLHGENKVLAELLSQCCVEEVDMNSCELGTDLVSAYMFRLADASLPCVATKIVKVADNDIHDRIHDAIGALMEKNYTLELLDLGFNQITDEGLALAKANMIVTAKSHMKKKLNELHVNLINNPCDVYALDAPGKTRSKFTLRFAYEHRMSNLRNIPLNARDHFAKTRRLDGEIHMLHPAVNINNIA